MAPPPKRKADEVATQTAGASGKVETIAKNGDIILQLGKVGATEREVLVSSAVLSIASPVFATMFDGRFREGQTLSAQSPCVLPLPDDDPQSVVIVVRIMHMQTFAMPTTLNPSALARLAVFCHKYDCVNAVRAWGMIWATALIQTPEMPGFENVLLSTYLLDLPLEFANVTKSLIRDRTEPFDITAVPNIFDYMSAKLISHIGKQHHESHKRALDTIGKAAFVVEECDESRARTALFFYDLRTVGLWPPALQSLYHLKTRMAPMKASELDRNLNATACGRNCYKYANHAHGARMKTQAVQGIEEIYDSITGLCLDCVKYRGLKDKYECRISHATANLTALN